MEKNIFYLNKELQLIRDKTEMVAVAYYFEDEDPGSIDSLGNARFKKIVEIMFLEPVGHKANWVESYKLIKEWSKEHYPQYHSFLPSRKICYLGIKMFQKIDNCWTRTTDSGWPEYRNRPVIMENGCDYLDHADTIVDNVFISLVLTKDEFLKINPNIELQE